MTALLLTVAAVFVVLLYRGPSRCRHRRWDVHPAQTCAFGTYGPYQICRRCGVICLVLPDGHPESLTRDLSPADEALLAAYDAELWPEEAK
jgi:hypothetical protein